MTMRDQYRDSPETAAAKARAERLSALLDFVALNLKMLSIATNEPATAEQLAALARIASQEGLAGGGEAKTEDPPLSTPSYETP